MEKLSDYESEIVIKKAKEVIGEAKTDREKIEKLFLYVRDGIKFGFPLKGDFVKASETIQSGVGQCNTKTTLFLALCKAIGIDARIHFSLIEKAIQRGIFPGFTYTLLPPLLSHSWLEAEINGKWHRIDTYINDKELYEKSRVLLKNKGWTTGYSIACSKNASTADLDLDNERFVQMDAVVGDHGTFDDPMDYYSTDRYKNKPHGIKALLYKNLIGMINGRIDRIRND
jgi:hypothetical protein